jgi:hypothetical protein
MSTQGKHLLFDRMVKRYQSIGSIELPQDLHGFSFELLTEFSVVFLVDLPSLKIKI